MKTINNAICTGMLVASALASATGAAEDRAMSAIAGCQASLGSVVESGNGLKAVGGTAVLRCPLLKVMGTSDQNAVYARIHRAQSSGSAPFCYLVSTPPYGTSSDISYGYASAYAGAQSINIAMPALYLTGYLDLYCLLNADDSLFGVRHVQVD